ncbi:MAG: DUF4922 domain-containing protein [Rikenellaceae bacterium]|nr:DUF4922 domain-containing protein [Rikenellaceae bacterium]
MSELQERVDRLIAGQIGLWETARNNYAGLQQMQTKNLDFGTFRFTIQFNPERARSTAAPVEKPLERPCFLCASNRPARQKSLRWNRYELLVNPYPIFDPHLTIATLAHIPQYLSGKIEDMLALSTELPEFVVTFNGARCGASAPDHFHFQAVKKGMLPAVKELPKWGKRHILHQDRDLTLWTADKYLRTTLVFESTSAAVTAASAERVLNRLKTHFSQPDEAQLNALCWYDSGTYTLVFFPRTAHRPRQYYARDDSRFLFSPGAIDMAGVWITVRQEDYQRTSVSLLTDLFSQVVPGRTQWERIEKDLKACLARNLK